MKTGSDGCKPCRLRLDVVTELVHEDQEHEPGREAPAPDQRVAADRDEDPEELDRERAELEQEYPERDQWRDELPQELLQGQRVLDR